MPEDTTDCREYQNDGVSFNSVSAICFLFCSRALCSTTGFSYKSGSVYQETERHSLQ